MHHLLEWFERTPTLRRLASAWGCALACLVVVGWLDAVVDDISGVTVSLMLFYLLPVAFVSWAAGRVAGVLIGVACGIVSSMADGSLYAGNVLSAAVWNAGSRTAFFICVASLIVSVRDLLLRVQGGASRDSLTGAFNRFAFYERVPDELARARRFAQSLTVVLLDLDNFKNVNDTYGHATGDALLCEVVDALRRGTRSVDTIARLGGDEFAILLPNADVAASSIVARRLHATLDRLAAARGETISASLAVMTCALMPDSVDDLVRMVDLLMYRAKAMGKNQILHAVFDGQTANPLAAESPACF